MLGDFGVRPSEQALDTGDAAGLADGVVVDVEETETGGDSGAPDDAATDVGPALVEVSDTTDKEAQTGAADTSADIVLPTDGGAITDTPSPDVGGITALADAPPSEADGAGPDTAQPDTAQPDTAQPDVVTPGEDVLEADAAESDTPGTDTVAEPDTPLPPDPEEDPDLDGLGPDDPCPTLWTPDGDGAPCANVQAWETMPGRAIVLPPADTRRVREVVEVPLVNGLIDHHVVGYWRVDGHTLDEGGQATLWAGSAAGFETDPWDRPGGAIVVSGASPGLVTDIPFDGTPPYTLALWAAPETDGTLVSGGAGDGTVRVWVEAPKLHAKVGELLLEAPWQPGWHHVALMVTSDRSLLLVDGHTVAAVEDHPSLWGADGKPVVVFGADPDGGNALSGRLDELLVLRRMIAPADLRSYVQVGQPWGTPLVPGSEADFDDVRAVVSTAWDAAPYAVPIERIGVMPHSDAACDMDTDDGSWADRVDLCGVHAVISLDDVGSEPGKGRFGEDAGAADLEWDEVDETVGFAQLGGEQTWEVWVRPEPCPPDETATLMSAGGVGILSIGEACALGVPALDPDPLAPGDWGRADQWIHVAVVSSATEDPTRTRIYVDGEQVGETEGAIPSLSGPVVLHGTSYAALDELILHGVAKSRAYLRRRGEPRTPSLRFLTSTEVTAGEDGGYDWHDYSLRWGGGLAPVGPAALHDAEGAVTYALVGPATGVVGSWRFEAHRPWVGTDHSAFGWDAKMPDGGAGTGVGVAFETNEADDGVTVPAWDAGDTRTIEVVWQLRSGDLFSLVGETDWWSLFVQGADVLLAGGAEITNTAAPPDSVRARTTVAFGPTAATLEGASGGSIATAFGASQGGSGVLALADGTGLELHAVRVTADRILAAAERLPVSPVAWSVGPVLWADGPPDADSDGVPDDGDGFGVAGDLPCTAGETVGCDDNCWLGNEDQSDVDGDGIGDLCEGGPVECTTDAQCDDGDGCTWGDGCDLLSGTCLETEPYFCDDWELCTQDSCDPAQGCVFVDLGACDEDNDGVPVIPGGTPCSGDAVFPCTDNCPLPNPDQADFDGDGVGDTCLLDGLASWLAFGHATEDTALHGPMTGTPGVRGGAIALDGAGYLVTPLTAEWFPEEAISFTGWVKCPAGGPNGAVMGYSQSPGTQAWFLHRWNADDYYTRYTDATNSNPPEQALELKHDTWQLLLSGWENNSDEPEGILYSGVRPGVQYNYNVSPDEAAGFTPVPAPLPIGAQAVLDGIDSPLTGSLDDVAFYNAVLSNEVYTSELYAAGEGGGPAGRLRVPGLRERHGPPDRHDRRRRRAVAHHHARRDAAADRSRRPARRPWLRLVHARRRRHRDARFGRGGVGLPRGLHAVGVAPGRRDRERRGRAPIPGGEPVARVGTLGGRHGRRDRWSRAGVPARPRLAPRRHPRGPDPGHRRGLGGRHQRQLDGGHGRSAECRRAPNRRSRRRVAWLCRRARALDAPARRRRDRHLAPRRDGVDA